MAWRFVRRVRLYCAIVVCILSLLLFVRISIVDDAMYTNANDPPFKYSEHRTRASINTSALSCSPLLTGELQTIGPIDAPRTALLRQRTRAKLDHQWNQGQHCGCRQTLMELVFGAEEYASADVYWSETVMQKRVLSLAHPDFSLETSKPDSITLLTQLTTSRLDALDLTAQRWAGPIIAAIYVKPKQLVETHQRLCSQLTASQRRNMMLHLVLAEGTLYPVNWLRNLVIRNSSSEFVFMIDADFVPSAGLEAKMQLNLRLLHDPQFSDVVHGPAPVRALIVPAFEILDASVAQLPSDKQSLLRMIDSQQADVFHRRTFSPAHDIWQFENWRELQSSFKLSLDSCSPYAEPYVALKRSSSPFLPETLLERGKNKAAYFFELCAADTEFTVLADEFLIHKYHPSTRNTMGKVRQCVFPSYTVFMDYLLARNGKQTCEWWILRQFKTWWCFHNGLLLLVIALTLVLSFVCFKIQRRMAKL